MMHKKLAAIVCIVIAYLFSSYLYAFAGNLNVPYLYHSYKNDINYSTSKIKENWKISLGAAALIGTSFFADKAVKSYFVKHQSKGMDHFTDIVKPFGNGFFVLPIAAGLGTIGYISKDDRLLNASYTSIESGLTAAAITGIIKFGAGRARPRTTGNTLRFKPFNLHNDYQSFPSGDVTVAWSFITPYAIYYHQPLLYLIPISVNVERIYKNAHWLSDTMMSTAIGLTTGYLFSKAHIASGFSVFTDGRTIDISWKF